MAIDKSIRYPYRRAFLMGGPNMADVAGPVQPMTDWETHRAKGIEDLRRSHAGQKTAFTDLTPTGGYSGVSDEMPIEEYFKRMYAKGPEAYGFTAEGMKPTTNVPGTPIVPTGISEASASTPVAEDKSFLDRTKEAMMEGAMGLVGLDPEKAGVAQDPSLLEYKEIKEAGLKPQDYASTSTYGMLEDIAEKNPVTRALAGTIGAGMLPITYAASPLYDIGQAMYRSATDPNLGIMQALKNENIMDMWKGRTRGAYDFLTDQFGFTRNRQKMVNRLLKNRGITNLLYGDEDDG